MAVGAALAAVPSTATAAPSSFMTGFTDAVYAGPDANTWFTRTTAAGARLVLLSASWASIAPQRPASDPSNPANPAYNWGVLDQVVRGVVAHGLIPAITVAGGGAPPWADGPGKPAGVRAGTWRPSASAFAAFAKAVARRYSGNFGGLPRVRYYEAWSEENLSNRLTPQWSRVHGHWVAESAIIYRGLLNAFYGAVKSVDRSDTVITGGLAPFGDVPGGPRVGPALFVRTLLCLGGSNSRLTLQGCRNPAHFDILAHHPYSIGGPHWRALNPDDVALADMWKLVNAVNLAARTGRALPRGHKRIWVTEFSWDSNPPDPQAVPMAKWEHWVEESFYVLWNQGVSAITWFLIADEPCVPTCGLSYQSGIFYDNGQPKPGFEAFRFPFVVEPAGRGRQRIWGITPRSGTVSVQELRAGQWRSVATFRKGAHAIFTQTIALSGHPAMRAVVGGETSITW
jgi:hypothetical protein